MSKSLVLFSLFASLTLSLVTVAEMPEPKAHAGRTRLFRPIDTTIMLKGEFILQKEAVDGKPGLQPYFKDQDSQVLYRITDCEDSCLKAISECEHGMTCRVRGDFNRQMGTASVVVKSIGIALDGLIKRTKSGAPFENIRYGELAGQGIKNPGAFGEAWRDPKGVVWGEAAKQGGKYLQMTQAEAAAYCKELGARLPTGWPEKDNLKHGGVDSDLVRLAKYMGDKQDSTDGYKLQLVGDELDIADATRGNFFWSNTVGFESSFPNSTEYTEYNVIISHRGTLMSYSGKALAKCVFDAK